MDLSKFKVENLFLLVGENPLPNYVAAQLLLEGKKKAHLVFSTHTKEVAGRLKNALRALKIDVLDAPLTGSEADGFEIARTIVGHVNKINSTEKIGLHYTGGTKTMAAHAYRAFLSLNRSPKPVFSYLDSRTLQICIDDLENQQTRMFPAVLDKPPSLETILALHNLKWKQGKEPQRQPIAKDAAIAFAKLHSHLENSWSWRGWCENTLHSLKRSKGENARWKDEASLREQARLDVSMLPESIVQVLSEYFLSSSESELDLVSIQEKYSFQSLEAVCQWFDGTWLEDFVLSQVQEVAATPNLTESVMSLRIEDPYNDKRETEQFEFDVAFLRGYQLFGISCTTSAIKSRCKQKLFEAILRAKQLGGDEARIALVCCVGSDRSRPYASAQPGWLKQEVSLAISDRKVEVFGREDLAPERFARKLSNWIKQGRA